MNNAPRGYGKPKTAVRKPARSGPSGPKVFDSRWAAHKEAALSEVLADGIVSLVDEDAKGDVEKRMAARPPWK